jgi:hypothetical protein
MPDGDCFHDGQSVLKTVKEMHDRIKKEKAVDGITSPLIQMVEEMLNVRPTFRPSAQDLTRKPNYILNRVKQGPGYSRPVTRTSNSPGSRPQTPPDLPPEFKQEGKSAADDTTSCSTVVLESRTPPRIRPEYGRPISDRPRGRSRRPESSRYTAYPYRDQRPDHRKGVEKSRRMQRWRGHSRGNPDRTQYNLRVSQRDMQGPYSPTNTMVKTMQPTGYERETRRHVRYNPGPASEHFPAPEGFRTSPDAGTRSNSRFKARSSSSTQIVVPVEVLQESSSPNNNQNISTPAVDNTPITVSTYEAARNYQRKRQLKGEYFDERDHEPQAKYLFESGSKPGQANHTQKPFLVHDTGADVRVIPVQLIGTTDEKTLIHGSDMTTNEGNTVREPSKGAKTAELEHLIHARDAPDQSSISKSSIPFCSVQQAKGWVRAKRMREVCEDLPFGHLIELLNDRRDHVCANALHGCIDI